MNIEGLNVNQFYAKANKLFKRCLLNEENIYLQEEIDVPLNLIITQNDCITIKFPFEDNEVYIIETKITLLSQKNEELGWYSYLEDENGNVIDDFLVFT